MKRHVFRFALLAPALFAGCTSLTPREAFPKLSDDIEARTGAKVVWRNGSDADLAVDQAIDDLLSRELTADSAVQIALLSNPSIQATYEELGIAQAELVEAGLLSNPIFSAMVKFADSGDPKIELGITQNFIELFSMPLRKRVASAKYEAAKLRVANEVIELATTVRKAFINLQAGEQSLDLLRAELNVAESASLAAERLRAAGNISELQLAIHQVNFGETKLELSRAQAKSMKAKEELTTLLGFWGSRTDLKLAPRLPELPEVESELADLESIAICQRFDLQSRVSELNANYESLGIARQFAWGDLEVSVEAERETDGEWLVGPGVSLPVPIFDTGAANVSIEQAKLRQAEWRLHALESQIRSEVRSAQFEMTAAREQVEFHKSKQLPLRENITRQSQFQYNAMQIGVFELLDAKRAEIQAMESYVESLRDYWIARAELERAIGGRLLTNESSTTQPTSQPISQPTKTNNHDQHQH
ncbi:MAG TPA: TolC family protein [Tepidisphaeraceae bacterium]|nr:TolC family protein [Tepidisphaeraceae bacterium]